jgi:hypothetical protein
VASALVLATLTAACRAGARAQGTPNPVPASPPASPGSACAPIGAAGEGVTVHALHTLEGGCVLPAHAVVYRCAEGLDSVAAFRLDTDAPEVFVGGRFAVQVRSIPEGARMVGGADRTHWYRIPGDPRFLYASRGSDLIRWLALPAPGSVPAPGALLIGDSILDGAEPYIGQALPRWTMSFDAQIGRASLAGVTIASAWAPTWTNAVVVELGTNDEDPLAFGQHADAILASFSQVPVIFWVTVHSPSDVAPLVNQEIRRAIAATPNGVIANWNANAPPHAFISDGVHLTPERQGVFANFLTPLLSAWRTAAVGGGDRRCEGDVRTAIA